MTTILLADDHSIIKAGLTILIKSIIPDSFIEETNDGDSTFEKIKSNDYDILILDVNMPNTDSLALVGNLKSLRPDLKILMFSMNDEEIFAKRYLKNGALGYIKKDAPQEEIKLAITTVLSNKRYMSLPLKQKLAEEILDKKTGNPFDTLSGREFEILQHLLAGESVGAISEKLSLHTSTVGTHKARIFTKLNCSNIIELSTLAKQHNIISG